MKTDNRQKLLIVAVGVMAALLIGDKLLYGPGVKLWQSRQREISRLQTQITEGSALIRREEIVRERWESMRTNTLPNNPSFAQEQLLKTLQDWAQESGASLSGLTPQWKNDSEQFKTLVCRINGEGTLWALARFIYNIEKGPLGLKLDSVDITSRDNTGRNLSLGAQVSALVLTPQQP
ncbi:MAG TPA: hypothetical protein VEH04_08465 [Verrucomicrobiae bacterium]|nr:hypothetical protein [Verrucomicrobiae bacterium]